MSARTYDFKEQITPQGERTVARIVHFTEAEHAELKKASKLSDVPMAHIYNKGAKHAARWLLNKHREK